MAKSYRLIAVLPETISGTANWQTGKLDGKTLRLNPEITVENYKQQEAILRIWHDHHTPGCDFYCSLLPLYSYTLSLTDRDQPPVRVILYTATR